MLSVAFNALNKIAVKKVANEKIKSETIFINTYLFLGIFKILLVIITVGAAFEFRPKMLLLLIPNMLVASSASYLYIKSLKRLPISLIAPLYLIYYPISMIFSILLLGEIVTIAQGLAMTLIFIIILILSITSAKSKEKKQKLKEKNIKEDENSKILKNKKYILHGIVYILLAGLLHAVDILLSKNAYNVGVYVHEMILYGGISNITVACISYNITKRNFAQQGKKYLYTLTPLMLIAVGIRFLASLSYTNAMKMGNATIVVPIVASNIFLVEILSAYVLKEKLKKIQYVSIVILMIAVFVLII